MEVIFFLYCLTLVLLSIRFNKQYITVISVITIPYMLLVPINNLLMTKIGFFQISAETIYMLSGGLTCIFIGSILADYINKKQTIRNLKKRTNQNKIQFYKIKLILYYVFFIEIICSIRLLIVIVQHGFYYLSTSDFEGQMLRGLFGHLLLTIYPLVPILFLFWLDNRKKNIYLIATLVCVGLLFTTFVKYHVIGMVVLLFFFVSIEKKQYAKKGALIVIVISSFFFITNYVVTFMFRGTFDHVDQSYYFRRLWNYLAGSLIYDNRIFTYGVRTNVSILYKLGSFIFPPLNLFLNYLFNVRIFPHVRLEQHTVEYYGQTGNVVDLFGYLYPSKQPVINLYLYVIVLIIIGFVFSTIYNNENNKKSLLSIVTATFLTFFVFFSFFGTFYVNSTCWEILFFSYLMPKFFDKRVHIIIR